MIDWPLEWIQRMGKLLAKRKHRELLLLLRYDGSIGWDNSIKHMTHNYVHQGTDEIVEITGECLPVNSKLTDRRSRSDWWLGRLSGR